MMGAKEFLQSIRDAERRIRAIRAMRAHYLEMACSMTGMSETNIRSTTKRSRVETSALELVELADELGGKAEELVGLVKKAEAVIAQIENPRYREVLSLRYLAGKSWVEVAGAMGYRDVHSAHAMHGWALKEFQRKMEKVIVFDL